VCVRSKAGAQRVAAKNVILEREPDMEITKMKAARSASRTGSVGAKKRGANVSPACDNHFIYAAQ
jgi:hypothetical protein